MLGLFCCLFSTCNVNTCYQILQAIMFRILALSHMTSLVSTHCDNLNSDIYDKSRGLFNKLSFMFHDSSFVLVLSTLSRFHYKKPTLMEPCDSPWQPETRSAYFTPLELEILIQPYCDFEHIKKKSHRCSSDERRRMLIESMRDLKYGLFIDIQSQLWTSGIVLNLTFIFIQVHVGASETEV